MKSTMSKPVLLITKDALGRIETFYEGHRLTQDELSARLAITVEIRDRIRCGYCGEKVGIVQSTGRQEEHMHTPLAGANARRCPWSDTAPVFA